MSHGSTKERSPLSYRPWLVGSIIVGLLVELSSLWIPADLKYVGALGVLIIILLFRPQGILGVPERVG